MSRNATANVLTRDSIMGMEVIDAKAHRIGKVQDIALSVGRSGLSLFIQDENDGEDRTIAWESVQAAGDYILLKPEREVDHDEVEVPSESDHLCPSCGEALTYVKQYDRWYCYKDKKYA
jgi:sporulation protein YlmC with PRC-barrel domain